MLLGVLATSGNVRPLCAATNSVSGSGWAKPAIEEILPGVWRIRFGQPERFTPNAVREADSQIYDLFVEKLLHSDPSLADSLNSRR